MTTANPDRARPGARGLIPDWLDERFTRSVAPVIRRLVLTRVNPDAVTLAAFLSTAAGGVSIARGWLMTACLLVVVGGILDFSDGKVATLTGRVTVFGGILDSTLDRYADAAIYLGLASLFARGGHWVTTWAALVALVGSMITSYLAALGRAHGLTVRDGLLRRQDRVTLITVGLILTPASPYLAAWLVALVPGLVRMPIPLLPLAPVVWVLAVLTNLTALQRLATLRRLAVAGRSGPEAESLRDHQIRTLRSLIDGEDRREDRHG